MLLFDYLAHTPPAFVTASALLGLVVGSFLNVVVHRLPRMLERRWRMDCRALLVDGAEPVAGAPEEPRYDLVVPRSRCPGCDTPIRARDNIPLLSYLRLRGRCAACGWRIPLRYPLVEALGAVLGAAAAAHFGFGFAALAAMGLGWALLALAFIDFDTQLLPDAITLPLVWTGLLVNLRPTFAAPADAIIGAVAGYGVLWTVYQAFRLATGKEGMGYGDFKLLAALGAWLGWQALPAVVLLSSAAGAVIGITLIAARGRERGMPIPFGPFLAAGGWLALLWGAEINHAYLRFAGLAH